MSSRRPPTSRSLSSRFTATCGSFDAPVPFNGSVNEDNSFGLPLVILSEDREREPVADDEREVEHEMTDAAGRAADGPR